MRAHRSLTALVLGLVVALVAACGGGGDSGASASATGTDPAGSETEIDQNAEIVWSYAVPPRALDPDKSASAFDLAYHRPVYDTLIRRSEENLLEPGLATSWEYVDPQTLELKLVEGVTFHDGEAFDADAVKVNLERTKTLSGGTQQKLLAGVESVEVVDPTTVRLNVTSGAAVVPGVLTSFPGMMISPAAINGGADLNTEAVGTGPYRLTEFDPAVSVTYERFEDSWEPEAAAAAKLTILIQADAGQRVNQMKTGQADMTHLSSNLVDAAEAAGYQVQAKTSDNVWYIAMNSTRPTLASAEARKAVNLAINREALISAIDFGYAELGSQIVPPGQPGHSDEVQPTFDVEEAKRLLGEAGVQGEKIRLLIQAIPTYTAFQAAIEQMLSDVGFEVESVTVETAQIPEELKKKEWDLYIGFWPGSADPSLTYSSLLGSGSQTQPAELPADVANLMANAESEIDPDARAAILEDLAAAVDEHSLIAVLSWPQRPTAATQEIVNFHGNVHSIPEFRGTGKRAS